VKPSWGEGEGASEWRALAGEKEADRWREEGQFRHPQLWGYQGALSSSPDSDPTASSTTTASAAQATKVGIDPTPELGSLKDPRGGGVVGG
jgi:hypothetical protein